MGLRLTIQHYYDFGTDRQVVGGDLVNPEAWDALRTETSGVFAMPGTRDEFVRAADARIDIATRAEAIDAWLERRGARIVVSYGVGAAALEWWLHKLRPARRLIVTDYGEKTVGRLSTVFPEVEARYHDLRNDKPLAADAHLFHRIDTELDDSNWRDVFGRFSEATILVVATQVLDLKRLLLELSSRPTIKRRRASRAGYLRTGPALEALWQTTHTAERLRTHDLHAWALTPRAPAEREGSTP